METTKFFDSHGTLWVACTAEEEGAQAFGPTGIAREASLEEIVELCGEGDGTPYGRASKNGRVEQGEDGFSYLK